MLSQNESCMYDDLTDNLLNKKEHIDFTLKKIFDKDQLLHHFAISLIQQLERHVSDCKRFMN